MRQRMAPVLVHWPWRLWRFSPFFFRRHEAARRGSPALREVRPFRSCRLPNPLVEALHLSALDEPGISVILNEPGRFDHREELTCITAPHFRSAEFFRRVLS
jgi:hypothetical protein